MSPARLPKECPELGHGHPEPTATRWTVVRESSGVSAPKRPRRDAPEWKRQETSLAPRIERDPREPLEDEHDAVPSVGSSRKEEPRRVPPGETSSSPERSRWGTPRETAPNGAARRQLPSGGIPKAVWLRLNRLLHVNEGPGRIHRAQCSHGVTTATAKQRASNPGSRAWSGGRLPSAPGGSGSRGRCRGISISCSPDGGVGARSATVVRAPWPYARDRASAPDGRHATHARRAGGLAVAPLGWPRRSARRPRAAAGACYTGGDLMESPRTIVTRGTYRPANESACRSAPRGRSPRWLRPLLVHQAVPRRVRSRAPCAPCRHGGTCSPRHIGQRGTTSRWSTRSERRRVIAPRPLEDTPDHSTSRTIRCIRNRPVRSGWQGK